MAAHSSRDQDGRGREALKSKDLVGLLVAKYDIQ
jgi:hypothetical protein